MSLHIGGGVDNQPGRIHKQNFDVCENCANLTLGEIKIRVETKLCGFGAALPVGTAE